MRKIFLVFFILIVIYSCEKNDVKKEYYSNGNIKAIGSFVNGKKHGKFVSYYENGNIEFSGKFNMGKEIGKHTVYYKDIKNQKKYIVVYDSIDKDNKILAKYAFDKDGKITYDATIKYIDLAVNVEKNVSDTVYVKLLYPEPKHEFFDFYIGKVDSYFTNGKNNLKFFPRDTNNYVIIPYSVNNNTDTLIIQGYLSNYDIIPINDSIEIKVGTIGVTRGDEIFFKQKLVLNKD